MLIISGVNDLILYDHNKNLCFRVQPPFSRPLRFCFVISYCIQFLIIQITFCYNILFPGNRTLAVHSCWRWGNGSDQCEQWPCRQWFWHNISQISIFLYTLIQSRTTPTIDMFHVFTEASLRNFYSRVNLKFSDSSPPTEPLLPVEALVLRKILRLAWRQDSKDMQHDL